MNLIFTLLLILHVIGGTIGLITGTINIIRKKGGELHGNIGMLFLYGMLTAGLSSLVLSVMHPNYFLFIVGIFTLYMTATGKRYLHFKQSGKKPGIMDWGLTGGMLLAGIAFLGFGLALLIRGNNFGIVFLAFSFIGLRFSFADMSNYRGKSKIKNFWLTGHLQRMIGSYIASTTAFLVVNVKYIPLYLPNYIWWLLPSVIFTPLIIIWTRKYRVI